MELGLGPSIRKPLLVPPPPTPAPTSQNPVLGTGSFHPWTHLGWALYCKWVDCAFLGYVSVSHAQELLAWWWESPLVGELDPY